MRCEIYEEWTFAMHLRLANLITRYIMLVITLAPFVVTICKDAWRPHFFFFRYTVHFASVESCGEECGELFFIWVGPPPSKPSVNARKNSTWKRVEYFLQTTFEVYALATLLPRSFLRPKELFIYAFEETLGKTSGQECCGVVRGGGKLRCRREERSGCFLLRC